MQTQEIWYIERANLGELLRKHSDYSFSRLAQGAGRFLSRV